MQPVIDEGEDEFSIPDLKGDKKEERICDVQAHSSRVAKSDALNMMRSLNAQQKQVFYNIRQWCIDKANGKNPDAFQVFVTGGAGTGKSLLVKCIDYEATRILGSMMRNPDGCVCYADCSNRCGCIQYKRYHNSQRIKYTSRCKTTISTTW